MVYNFISSYCLLLMLIIIKSVTSISYSTPIHLGIGPLRSPRSDTSESGFGSGDVCPPLEDPDNGRVTVTGFGIGDEASYTCDQGYQLDGVSSLTCSSDGQWSSQPPTCTQSMFDSLYKATRTFHCNSFLPLTNHM